MTTETEQEPRAHEKRITIVINGRPVEIAEKSAAFEEIVALAFPNQPPSEATVYTVTYKGAHGNKPQGTLVAGESVKLKEGMVFNVTATNRS